MFKVGQRIRRNDGNHYGVGEGDIVHVVRMDGGDGVVISRTLGGSPINGENGPIIFTAYKFEAINTSDKDKRLLLC